MPISSSNTSYECNTMLRLEYVIIFNKDSKLLSYSHPFKVVNELRSIIAGGSCFCNLNKIVGCLSALYINDITKANAIYLIDRITEVLDRDVCAINDIAQ